MMNRARQKIRIGIHIEVEPGIAGGTAQSTHGLISSLGKLDGPEEYVLVAQTQDQADWIKQYCGPNQRLLTHDTKSRNWSRNSSNGHPRNRAYQPIKGAARSSVLAARWMLNRLTPQTPFVSLSNGYYESLECDVLHFPTQAFMLCAVRTIYNPHDLQHLHYPQFFTASELAWRETVYRSACQFAHTVVVGSNWVKEDVIRQYAIHPEKIQIVPWAPPTTQYVPVSADQVEEARHRLGLPETYALYPAVTWPHKNHLRLLEALATLRDSRGLIVNLVCTGARGPSWSRVEQQVQELNLSSQVRFCGFLSETDLLAVYRLAQFLILPSLFEADSCPIYEAWSEGIPVASSNHTALPDQVADAGLLFDAGDTTAIAETVERMATDDKMRRQLVERGYRRVRDFDWDRTAKAYRAVYRRASGATLTEEDRWLLEWDWMRDPDRTPGIGLIQ